MTLDSVPLPIFEVLEGRLMKIRSHKAGVPGLRKSGSGGLRPRGDKYSPPDKIERKVGHGKPIGVKLAGKK